MNSPHLGHSVSEPRLAPGTEVSWRDYPGTVTAVSPEGIHFRVVFHDPTPPIRHLIDGGCWFYAHELERR